MKMSGLYVHPFPAKSVTAFEVPVMPRCMIMCETLYKTLKMYSSKNLQNQPEHYGEQNHLTPIRELNPGSLVVQQPLTYLLHQLSNPGFLLSHKDIFIIEEKSTYIENGASMFL
jgi:hypothetical protein